jgi:hypothetical protein
MPHGYSIDTGMVSYTVVSKAPTADSTRWQLFRRRTFTRSIYGIPYTLSEQDSGAYELVEMATGRHEVYAPSPDAFGVFPFQKADIDSLRFFRYSATDSSGEATIQIKYPTGEMEPRSCTFWLRSEFGPLKVIEEFALMSGSTTARYYLRDDTVLSAGTGDSRTVISSYVDLEPNYPNPFNSGTVIRFSITRSSFVTLKVYNLLGQEVATLASGLMKPGTHEESWNPLQQPSGVYLCRLNAGDMVRSRKIVLLK